MVVVGKCRFWRIFKKSYPFLVNPILTKTNTLSLHSLTSTSIPNLHPPPYSQVKHFWNKLRKSLPNKKMNTLKRFSKAVLGAAGTALNYMTPTFVKNKVRGYIDWARD